MAQKQLQTQLDTSGISESPSPLSAMDWQLILEKLYERKGNERQSISEGDPRKYRDLAVAIGQTSEAASDD